MDEERTSVELDNAQPDDAVETAPEAAETPATEPVAEPVSELVEESKEESEAPSEAAEDEMEPDAPDYVKMTLESGVAPLEMRFSQINHCYRKRPIAYRSHTFINSVTMGVLTPEQYTFASDGTERGITLARWNIEQAIATIRAMQAAGRNVQFVTARCPARLALEDDLFEWMKGLLDELDFHTPELLCLEFPQSLLFEDEEKVRLSILNMKLLKVKTMMSGCGADDCPIAKLIRIPVDYVLLDPDVTTLIDNRNKSNAIQSLIGYLRSIPVEVIGEGVYNENQITALSRSDCFGYIPSSGFQGDVFHGSLRMTLGEAVSQREEDF